MGRLLIQFLKKYLRFLKILKLNKMKRAVLLFKKERAGREAFVKEFLRTVGLIAHTKRPICRFQLLKFDPCLSLSTLIKLKKKDENPELIKRLIEKIKTEADRLAKLTLIFQSIQFGHLQILKLLLDENEPHFDHFYYCSCFRCLRSDLIEQSMINGHVEIARYILKLFEFTLNEPTSFNFYILRNLVHNTSSDVLDLLIKEYEFNPRFGDDFLLKYAIHFKKPEVISYLWQFQPRWKKILKCCFKETRADN
jgi:hypothetical protein